MQELLQYIKKEKTDSNSMYESDVLTNKLDIHIKPEALKNYSENKNNTNLNTDLPSKSKLNSNKLKIEELSGFVANKNNSYLNAKNVNEDTLD